MARLRCPRCATVVEVAEGAPRVCPACGFGKPAPPAPSAAPAPPVAASPPTAPSSGKARRGIVIAAVAVAAILLVGGIVAGVVLLRHGGAGGKTLDEATARQRVVAALHEASLATGGTATDAQLSKAEMHMTQPAGAGAPGGGLFGGGPSDVSLTMEWGTGGSRQATLQATSGAITISFQMVCTDRQYLVYGGHAYAERPNVVHPPCGDGGEGGLGDLGSPGLGDGETPLSALDANADGATLDRRPDGSVVATLDENGTHATVTIDAAGHLMGIDSTGPDGTLHAAYTYGARRGLTAPSNPALMPTKVDTRDDVGDFSSPSRRTVINASDQQPPRADLELRLMPWSAGPNGTPVATFPLAVDGPQASGNWTFTYDDADHDGKVSAGDAYTLANIGGDGLAWSDVHAVLYDKVAGGAVNSSPMGAPGLGAAWLALALAGLAAARRLGGAGRGGH